jgi:hypothetical protein
VRFGHASDGLPQTVQETSAIERTAEETGPGSSCGSSYGASYGDDPLLPFCAIMRERVSSRAKDSQRPVGPECARGAPTASDIEGPTDLDWVGLCLEAEIPRCALNLYMA